MSARVKNIKLSGVNVASLFLIIIFIVLSGVYIDIYFGNSESDGYVPVIINLVLLSYAMYFWNFSREYSGIRYFSFQFLFPFGFFVVFFQIALLDAFGFSVLRRFQQFIWAGEGRISPTIIIAALGVVAYFLGCASSVFKNTSRRKSNLVLYPNSIIRLSTYLAFLFYSLFILNSGSLLSGAYVNDGTWLASYATKLFTVSLSTALFVNLWKIQTSDVKRLSILRYLLMFYKPLLFLLCLHILLSFFVGDRGPVIVYSTLLLSVYLLNFRKLSFLEALAIIVAAGAIFTLVGEARTRVGGEAYVERMSQAASSVETSKWYGSAVPGQSFIELALSVRTLAVATRDVPNEFPYQLGMFQLQQVVSVVPGAQGAFNELVYDGDPRFNGSANFFTFLIHRRPVDYGDGSSLVADLFLDFGVVGVVLVMFWFGKFFSGLERLATRRELNFGFGYIVYFTLLSNAVYLSRSTLMLEFSGIVWSFMLVKLLGWFMSMRARNFEANPV